MIHYFRAIRRRLLETASLRRYLLYAVGEVTLVVVGILIALQVNNWNEGRNEDRLAGAYTAGVAADLARDAAAIGDYLAYIQRELDAYEGYRARLSAPTATADTLLRIARYEFDPVADQLPAFHDNTFQSIQSSGNLQLLEPWLAEALTELDRLQRWSLDVEEVLNTLYYHAAVAYQYPLGEGGVLGEGPLSEFVWGAVDPTELAARFNQLASLKQVKVSWEQIVLREVLAQGTLIRERLTCAPGSGDPVDAPEGCLP